jgi:hypothetical protein
MGATKRNVDFSDVKDRGAFNPKLVPDGDYLAKIIKVEDAEVQSSTSSPSSWRSSRSTATRTAAC